MEYGHGDLETFCKYREANGLKWKAEETQYIFNQLIIQIETLRKIKVRHNDIKAQNVIITYDGLLKFTDYSSATFIHDIEEDTVYRAEKEKVFKIMSSIIANSEIRIVMTSSVSSEPTEKTPKQLEQESRNQEISSSHLEAFYEKSKVLKQSKPRDWLADKEKVKVFHYRDILKVMSPSHVIWLLRQLWQYYMNQECIELANIVLETRGNDAMFQKDFIEFTEQEKKSKYDSQVFLAQIHNMLGMALDKDGRYDLALESHDNALNLKNEIWKTDPKVADLSQTFNNIANILCKQDKKNDAIDYYQKAIEEKKKIEGDKNQSVARYHNNIGSILVMQNKYPEAEEHLQTALNIRLELNDSPIDTASSYFNLGNLYFKKKDYNASMEKYSEALKIRKDLLGMNHPDIARCYQNIGNVFFEMGELNESLQYYNKAKDMQINIQGENHHEVREIESNIKKVQEALEKLTQKTGDGLEERDEDFDNLPSEGEDAE